MAYEVDQREIEPQPVLLIRAETTPTGIGPTYRDAVLEIESYLGAKGIEPAGPPFARFPIYTQDRVVMEAGVPVSSGIGGQGRIEAGELPGGAVATTVHVGSYKNLGAAHAALTEWLGSNGKRGGAPWEIYLAGPAEIADSYLWRTQIVYPLLDR
jgi:effector-binding domain-containing protein